ncbi:MAG: site-2 protease family protein [Saccharothrix sp.]|nr:site-2 protease family protein [Saccharothrix sp.]
MRATFRLGRIAGVRVGVHWSVLVIATVIVVGLAHGRLPDAHPGRPQAAYWVLGVLTAVVFLMSLLAHELAHAVVARRNGVEVDDIVLWMLGGVARLKGEAATPGAELRIAGVGPLVSLVLGGAFTVAAGVVNAAAGRGLAVEALVWLAVINILLGVFNAIPAAPLDGGRLLLAALWWRSGDRLRAMAGAARAGRVFGWFLALLGVVRLLDGAGVGGLWLVLIGWFLVAAATAEGRQAQLRETLTGIPVRNAMTREPVTMPQSLTLAEFLGDPRHHLVHSAFPVVDAMGTPLGLVTVRAARQVPAGRRRTTSVGDVMLPRPEVVVVAPDDELADLVPKLAPAPEYRALVVDGERLVGMVSGADIERMVTWLVTTYPRRRTG